MAPLRSLAIQRGKTPSRNYRALSKTALERNATIKKRRAAPPYIRSRLRQARHARPQTPALLRAARVCLGRKIRSNSTSASCQTTNQFRKPNYHSREKRRGGLKRARKGERKPTSKLNLHYVHFLKNKMRFKLSYTTHLILPHIHCRQLKAGQIF